MTDTHMKREIAEIPAVAERLLRESGPAIRAAAAELRTKEPAFMVTVARGSSDHAATFFKYACELTLGVPVASLGPSLASVYDAPLKLERAAALTISQSGQSPDIVALIRTAVRSGATGIALINDPLSPLADASSVVVDLRAGEERSVAATKTFVASLVTGAALVAHWRNDPALLDGIERLPEALSRTLHADWNALETCLLGAERLFVLGRGPGIAIAAEAALKFKETCGIHAEAYSTAEVLHGPAALVGRDFPVLAFALDDKARPAVLDTCRLLAGQGADLFVTDPATPVGTALPFERTGHPLLDAICLVATFHGFVEGLARRRGLDPDRPPHLRKVTATV